LSTEIKDLLDRVRPTANPLAHTLGPSFPSGHTTGAAACFAAFALVLGRGRSRNTQAVLAGGGVFIALAVGASRVLLGVHWLTDVLGGLALGWAWFALCSIAFGGRLLRLGTPVEAVARVTEAEERAAKSVDPVHREFAAPQRTGNGRRAGFPDERNGRAQQT
jgi:membrane-associated phospholipid phosphatase